MNKYILYLFCQIYYDFQTCNSHILRFFNLKQFIIIFTCLPTCLERKQKNVYTTYMNTIINERNVNVASFFFFNKKIKRERHSNVV